MKNFIVLLMAGFLMTACGNNAANTEAEIAKAKQHMLDSIKTVDSLKAIAEKQQKSLDSLNKLAAEKNVRKEKREGVEPRYADAESKPASAEPATKKKGWSSTAKGAVIGAGIGAIGGAIIDKKHGEGAIIGGIIGAGAGAGTGAIIDAKKKKADTARKQ